MRYHFHEYRGTTYSSKKLSSEELLLGPAADLTSSTHNYFISGIVPYSSYCGRYTTSAGRSYYTWYSIEATGQSVCVSHVGCVNDQAGPNYNGIINFYDYIGSLRYYLFLLNREQECYHYTDRTEVASYNRGTQTGMFDIWRDLLCHEKTTTTPCGYTYYSDQDNTFAPANFCPNYSDYSYNPNGRGSGVRWTFYAPCYTTTWKHQQEYNTGAWWGYHGIYNCTKGWGTYRDYINGSNLSSYAGNQYRLTDSSKYIGSLY